MWIWMIAMKIHLTNTTKMILDDIGGYHTEPRGTVEVKVRGFENEYNNSCLGLGLWVGGEMILLTCTG